MNETTLEKMQKMNLLGMHRAFKTSIESGKTENYTSDEMIANLIESEWDDRRNIDKNQIMRFADCTFINNNENILFTGSTGIGKSYIASAIGHQACNLNFKVAYHNTAKLIGKLKIAKADNSYTKEVAKIEKQNLLILDDFGIQPFDAQGRAMLMEIIEDRHGKGSLIITSQVPVSKWYDIIGDKTMADAILDRIIHQAHRVELKGESMRKKKNEAVPVNI
jgi:DNA replication protein DnaC